VFAADLDGDGDVDILSATAGDNTIGWYDNNGSESFQRRLLANDFELAAFVTAADIDGDGRLDVLAASHDDGEVAWFRNEAASGFRRRAVTRFAHFAQMATPADLDGDGRLDILWTAGYNGGPLAWQQNFAAADYGDAPTPYPVASSRDGASHAAQGPRLGALRDAEIADLPPASAADDDGVTINPLRVGQLQATAVVTVQNAPLGARLDAWIDFNRDGNWGGDGERIAFSAAVVEGANVITFNVPSWAQQGTSYARFRVGTAGQLGPMGGAADGEVEDYAVSIAPAATTSGNFVGHVLGAAPTGMRDAYPIDLDRDGDVDVVAADASGALAWFENRGVQGFAPRVVDPVAINVSAVAADDFDGDGDIDVVAGRFGDSPLAWYENDGAQQFTTHVISIQYLYSGTFYSISLGDLEGDGDTDLFLAGTDIFTLRNDGAGQFIDVPYHFAESNNTSIHAADMDRDGDLDAVNASAGHDRYSVFKNNGSHLRGWDLIETQIEGPSSVFPVDLNRDGYMDVLSAASNDGRIVWHRNDGNGAFSVDIIEPNPGSPVDLFVADVDGDGDLDFVASEHGSGKGLVLYENDGQLFFTPRPLDPLLHSTSSVTLADMDGDGDLDIVATSIDLGRIVWYENLPRGDYNRDSAVAGDDFLAWQRSFGSSAAPPGSGADGSRNGVVDAGDLSVWAGGFGTPQGTAWGPVGDFSGDRVVDGGDFLEWQRAFGSASVPTGTGADADRSGFVDESDLEVWASQFPNLPSQSAAAALALSWELSGAAPTSSGGAGFALDADLVDPAAQAFSSVQTASSPKTSKDLHALRRASAAFSVATSAHDAALARLADHHDWRWQRLKRPGHLEKQLVAEEPGGRDEVFTDFGIMAVSRTGEALTAAHGQFTR
jgi:hypothetical protein